jgi:hypothetical protein
MTKMNDIGLDVHKKTISYCVKDAAGHVLQEARPDRHGANWTTGSRQQTPNGFKDNQAATHYRNDLGRCR